MNPKRTLASLLLALAALASAAAQATDTAPAVAPVALADHLYTFTNTMANSAALIGDEGVFLVDSGDKPEVAARLQAAIAALTPKPVRLLVNTHWHFDHVTGNENFGTLGATIIGHTLMRQRVATQEHPLSAAGLPAITFDHELTLQFAGEEIQVLHPTTGPGHTDGDVVVYFRHANVVHMGDLFFNGMYPYIDFKAGGWIDGMIAACREVLARIDDKTVIVPGHGPVSNKSELEAYVAMLTEVSSKVTALAQAGKTLDEVKAATPTAALDKVWERSFLPRDRFVEMVYNGIAAHAQK